MIPDASSSCVRNAGAPVRKRASVVVGDLRQRVAVGVVEPDLPEALVVADVLLDEHPPAVVDRNVVEQSS
jgi:hypothetical protein